MSRIAVSPRLSVCALIATLALSIADVAPANASSPSPVDSSSAVRYDSEGRIIGNIIESMIKADARSSAFELPFPLNVYGQRYPYVCVGTDGSVMPSPDATSCTGFGYDTSIAMIAALLPFPVISALGIDSDPSELLHNPHRNVPTELSVASYSVDAQGVMTMNTTEAHGFVVGDLVRGSGSGRPESVIVSAVLSTTSYEGLSPEHAEFPLEERELVTPGAGERTVVYREVLMDPWEIGSLTIDGSSLVIVDGDNPPLVGPGRTITIESSGIIGLDGADLTVVSRNGDTIVTNVPPGLVDVDPTTSGDQTSYSFDSESMWLLERDNVGAIQQVSVGSSTIDGRDAVVVTWYRLPTNDSSNSGSPAINPETMSNTFQMVLLKRTTGSDTAGWDFDVEINFGHVLDKADGYSTAEVATATTAGAIDPTTGCRPANPETCVWPAGMGRPLPGFAVSSYSISGTAVRVTTVNPHELSVFDHVYTTELYDQLRRIDMVVAVIDAYTVEFANVFELFDEPVTSAPENSYLIPGEGCELFTEYVASELGDTGGATALVSNSLNNDVSGRYIFGVVDGAMVGCLPPVMGSGATYAPEFEGSDERPTRIGLPNLSQEPTLPNTGSSATSLVTIGLLMLFGGAVMLIWNRRLRHRFHR